MYKSVVELSPPRTSPCDQEAYRKTSPWIHHCCQPSTLHVHVRQSAPPVVNFIYHHMIEEHRGLIVSSPSL
jgi:hypothetical protein